MGPLLRQEHRWYIGRLIIHRRRFSDPRTVHSWAIDGKYQVIPSVVLDELTTTVVTHKTNLLSTRFHSGPYGLRWRDTHLRVSIAQTTEPEVLIIHWILNVRMGERVKTSRCARSVVVSQCGIDSTTWRCREIRTPCRTSLPTSKETQTWKIVG